MNVIIGIILAIIVLGFIILIPRVSVKFSFIIILLTALSSTVAVCVAKPVMHKPVAMSVIKYIKKLNDDGTATITKQTTTINLGKTK